MKRILILIGISMICASFFVTTAASAQEPEPIEIADLLSWAKSTPPDWGRGILYAILGLIGSLITIFGFIGGAVPGTAGKARIDAETERLDRLSQRLEEVTDSPHPNASVIKAIERTVNNLRDDLRTERWRQFAIATILYAVLGAFFSTLIARDILQAIVIGAGWTGFLGTLGLQKDYAERKVVKDKALEKTISRVKELESNVRTVAPTSIPVNLRDPEGLKKLERDVRIAQSL